MRVGPRRGALLRDRQGKRLGKDRSTIYRYEKGDIENLPLDILEPIADALQTTPQYLMGWEAIQKKSGIIADAALRMKTDDAFMSIVEILLPLNSEKIDDAKQMLSLLLK